MCVIFFFSLVMEIFNSFVDFFFFIFVIDKNYFYSFWERLISGATYYYKKTEKLWFIALSNVQLYFISSE